MNIRAIFIDLDGTLLNSRLVTDRETRDCLLEYERSGGRIVLASARPYIGMERYGRELELSRYGGYYCAFNGGRLVNAQTLETTDVCGLKRPEVEKIYAAARALERQMQTRALADIGPFPGKLTAEYAKAVWEAVGETNLNLMVYRGDTLIMTREETYGVAEAIVNNMKRVTAADFLRAVDFEPVKILISASVRRMPKVYASLRECLGSECDVTASDAFLVEITPKGVNKGNALEKLCGLLGIFPEQTAAFGDSDNDIPMLKRAGIGIAMGNAPESVKQAADDVTLSNDENGIAHFLLRNRNLWTTDL